MLRLSNPPRHQPSYSNQEKVDNYIKKSDELKKTVVKQRFHAQYSKIHVGIFLTTLAMIYGATVHIFHSIIKNITKDSDLLLSLLIQKTNCLREHKNNFFQMHDGCTHELDLFIEEQQLSYDQKLEIFQRNLHHGPKDAVLFFGQQRYLREGVLADDLSIPASTEPVFIRGFFGTFHYSVSHNFGAVIDYFSSTENFILSAKSAIDWGTRAIEEELRTSHQTAVAILLITMIEGFLGLLLLVQWNQSRRKQNSLIKELKAMKPSYSSKIATTLTIDEDMNFGQVVRQRPVVAISRQTKLQLISVPQHLFNVGNALFLDLCETDDSHIEPQILPTASVQEAIKPISPSELIKPFIAHIYDYWNITMSALTALGKHTDNLNISKNNNILKIIPSLINIPDLKLASSDEEITHLSNELVEKFKVNNRDPSKVFETWTGFVTQFKEFCKNEIQNIKSKSSKKVMKAESEYRPYHQCRETFNSNHPNNELRFSIQQSEGEYYFITILARDFQAACGNDINRSTAMLNAIKKGMVGPKGKIGIAQYKLNGQIYYVIKPHGDDRSLIGQLGYKEITEENWNIHRLTFHYDPVLGKKLHRHY